MPAKSEPQQNHLLAALSPEVQGRLFPYLELVPLPLRAVMYESGRANSAPVLFDALVLPDGVAGVANLARHDQTMDFIRDQYRHGKTILALGASKALLVGAGIPATLPSGERDPGILLARGGEDASAAFIAAVGKHRHTEREAALLRA